MLKLHTVYADFHGREAKSWRWPKITAHDQNHGNHGDLEYVTDYLTALLITINRINLTQGC